jgi:hypothetical protein
VLTKLSLNEAEVIERPGLAGDMTRGPVEVQRADVMVGRPAIVTLPVEHPSQIDVGQRLVHAVSQLFEQVERPPEVVRCLPVLAEHVVSTAEATVGMCLPAPVAKPGRGVQGEALHGDLVGQETLQVEVVPQRPGQLPGVNVESAGDSLLHGGEQHLVLGGEPRECLLAICDVLGADIRPVREHGDRVSRRVQQLVGGVRAVQVVVERPAYRLAPSDGCVDPGQFGGVRAHQVVHGEPPGQMFGDQMRMVQLGEQSPGARQRCPGHAGRGGVHRGCCGPRQ